MYFSIYVFISLCIHICVGVYVRMCMCTFDHMCVCVCVCVCVCATVLPAGLPLSVCIWGCVCRHEREIEKEKSWSESARGKVENGEQGLKKVERWRNGERKWGRDRV